MNIQTRYHGEQQIDRNDIIEFPSGIPGFLDERAFVLLPLVGKSPFFILQSTKTRDLAFVITPPFVFFEDYELNLPEATVEQLEIEDEGDVALFCILTLQEPFTESTVNLKAPLVINQKNQVGKQVLLNTERYHSKHTLPAQASAGQEESHARP